MNSDFLSQSLPKQGYALLPSLLSPDLCNLLIESYNDSKLYRKTIEMQRYRFGQGEYKYFNTHYRK